MMKPPLYRLAALLLAISGPFGLTQSATETTLYSFTGVDRNDGPLPDNLILASDGNFYGTTEQGGANSLGSIYRYSLTSGYTSLYSFAGGQDGSYPYSGVVEGPDGKLYGAASSLDESGTASGNGCIFRVAFDGTFQVVHGFQSSEGTNPFAAPVLGPDGLFYTTTYLGGTKGYGTVLKFTLSGQVTTIYNFTNADDGENPRSSLMMAADGNYYGTTNQAGPDVFGTMFRVSPGGVFDSLHVFTGGTDGGQPFDTHLVDDGDGNIIGTTSTAGTDYNGTLFKVSESSGVLSTLYNFMGSTDGSTPLGGLISGSDGAYYGTFYAQGGTLGGLFRLEESSSTPTTIYDFPFDYQNDSAPGSGPVASPIQGADGSFYGTTFGGGSTSIGGSYGDGVIYKITSAAHLAPPIVLSLSGPQVVSSQPVVLNWTLENAASLSMQQCYAFVQGGAVGAGVWTGRQTGSYESTTRQYSGSATIKPTAAGSYTYALTCGGVESGFSTLVVTAGKASSKTTVAAAPNPAMIGQSIAFTTTVTGPGTPPTGSVTFSVGGTSIGTYPLTSGSASILVSSTGLPVGDYLLTATYSGNSDYTSSESTSTTVVLNKSTTTTTIAASPNPVTPPAYVNLSATVERPTGSSGVPAGTVTFYADGALLQTVNLNSNGVASFAAPTSAVVPGSYSITAKYSGDTSDAASTATAIPVTVK